MPRENSGGADMETAAESNEDKCKMLWATFFPKLKRDNTSHADIIYPTPKFKFNQINNKQIHRVITRLRPFKAPRLDGIPNIMLIRCVDLLVPHLGPLYWVTFKLNVYPTSWRDSVTIMLRKPGKADYTMLNAHQPVAILNTIVNVFSACIAEDLTHAAKTQGLLLRNHFRSRPSHTTTDYYTT